MSFRVPCEKPLVCERGTEKGMERTDQPHWLNVFLLAKSSKNFQEEREMNLLNRPIEILGPTLGTISCFCFCKKCILSYNGCMGVEI